MPLPKSIRKLSPLPGRPPFKRAGKITTPIRDLGDNGYQRLIDTRRLANLARIKRGKEPWSWTEFNIGMSWADKKKEHYDYSIRAAEIKSRYAKLLVTEIDKLPYTHVWKPSKNDARGLFSPMMQGFNTGNFSHIKTDRASQQKREKKMQDWLARVSPKFPAIEQEQVKLQPLIDKAYAQLMSIENEYKMINSPLISMHIPEPPSIEKPTSHTVSEENKGSQSYDSGTLNESDLMNDAGGPTDFHIGPGAPPNNLPFDQPSR